jgi:glycosyltransferase involved in cell wall biosynthesis
MGLSIGSPTWAANLYIPALRRITTRFIAISAAVSEMLEAHGVPEAQTSVVHNGVPIADIDATIGLPPPIGHPGPKVGMVAAYDPRKGHQLFVEAASLLAPRYPDARFYIIGGVLEGQRESIAFYEYIRTLIESHRLDASVVSVGQVQADEIYSWIRALDVLVVPSRTEAFGYVQFEAMACNRPVIATRIEGNLDAFIDGESGIYVGQSADEVARATDRVFSDPELATRLGDAGRRRVERFFDEREMIPLLAGVVERTLA